MNPAFLNWDASSDRPAFSSDGLELSAGCAKTWKQMRVRRYELHVSFVAQTSQEARGFFQIFLFPPVAQQSNLSAKSLVSSCPLSFFWGLIIFGSGCKFVVDGWFVGVHGAAVGSTDTHTHTLTVCVSVCVCVCDCCEPAQGLMEYPWRCCCPPFHLAPAINNCTAVRLRHQGSIRYDAHAHTCTQTHAKAWVWTPVWGNLFDQCHKKQSLDYKSRDSSCLGFLLLYKKTFLKLYL